MPLKRIRDKDLMDLKKWFEDSLSRASRIDRKQKMRLRRKVRDEVYYLLTWEKPTPMAIMNRWEDRLSDVFKTLPYGFKEDLLKLLVKKLQLPLR